MPNRDQAAYLTATANCGGYLLANRAFGSKRGLVGGLALLVATGLGMAGLSGCGAPSYTYVADSAAKTYYKVPNSWHPISNESITAALAAAGAAGPAIWPKAFHATNAPTA